MDTLITQFLNSLFYASILFLIASGLSLVYGVMRIVNMAHGNLYAIGAYVAAWAIGLASSELHVSLLFVLLITGALAAALAGAIIEPAFLRPLYRRAEEYQLLMTFGLLLVLEDVMRSAASPSWGRPTRRTTSSSSWSARLPPWGWARSSTARASA